MAYADQLSISAPRSLGEALSLAHVHRERVRWLIGESTLLGLSYKLVPRESFILDARNVPELWAGPRADGPRFRFGAFASEARLRAHPITQRLISGEIPPMLALLVAGASVEVASLGRVRTRHLDALALAAYEAPVAVIIEAPAADEVCIERRRAIRDGDASHELHTVAVFGVAPDGAIRRARIALAVDDLPPVRGRAAERHLEGHRLASERCADAARLCAEAIVPRDARSAAAARSALPLALSLLRQARIRCDAARLYKEGA